MRPTLLAFPLLFSVACSSGPPPVAMGDYCAREAMTLCALAARCSCGLDMAACVANDEAGCNGVLGDPELSMAVSAGTVRWDGDVAAALLAKTEAMPPRCDRTLDVFGLTLAESGSFGGALVGTLPTGSPCVPLTSAGLSECADGACVAHTCAQLVDVGAPCDTSTLCLDLARPLSWQSTSPSALCAHGVCVRQNAPPGSPCTSGPECASATCTMMHCQGLPDGLGCIEDAACESETCDAGSCVAASVAVGAACGTTAAGPRCVRGAACIAGTCIAGLCADVAP